MFTILPSHGGRFTTIPSTSNQKGIFCSSSFLMSMFCEKNVCFALPGGVCVFARECLSVHMSDEVFGNRRAGLIITDISLDAFRPRSSWERSVMPPDPKSEREKMRERKVTGGNDEERQRTRKAHKKKKKGGKV